MRITGRSLTEAETECVKHDGFVGIIDKRDNPVTVRSHMELIRSQRSFWQNLKFRMNDFNILYFSGIYNWYHNNIKRKFK